MTNGKEKIAKNWKKRILNIFLEHEDWNSTDVRDKLLDWLGEAKTPGKSSIQKEWARLKIEYGGIRNLDNLWHLGTLEIYPLPSEALPYVMMVQKYAEQYPDPLWKQPQKPVTIRQAKWISRLYVFQPNFLKHKEDKRLKLISALYAWSKAYATQEIICKLLEMPIPDTTNFDKAFMNGESSPITVNGQWVLFHKDKTFEVDSITAKDFLEKESEE